MRITFHGSDNDHQRRHFLSGGVAMVFNNTVTGTTYHCRTIEISHGRSSKPISESGMCDGTNPIDGHQVPAGQYAYPPPLQGGREAR